MLALVTGWPAAAGATSAANSGAPPSSSDTGIQLHGQWAIDVVNPDGTIASHTEFENSLVTQTSGAILSNDHWATFGDEMLASLLSGNIVPGNWGIYLVDSANLCGTSATSFPNPEFQVWQEPGPFHDGVTTGQYKSDQIGASSTYESITAGDQVSVSVTGSASTLTAPTGITVVAVTSSSATLTWSAVAGATTYRVFYWPGAWTNRSTSVQSAASTRTSNTLTGLSPATTYSFYIQSEENVQGSKTSGPASAVMTFTTTP